MKNIYKLLFIFLPFALTICIGCTKSDEKKQVFIKNNIAKTNQKNIDRYGDLIVPDFLFEKDVTTVS